MVKKLYKYEILSYLRLMVPVQIALLGLALINRTIQIFEVREPVYNIVFVSSLVLYIIGCLTALILTGIFAIVRYQRNLFGGEGYLTLTLPVTPRQQIWAKALAAATMLVSTFLVILLSVMIVSSGDMLIELFKAAGYLFKRLLKDAGYHTWLYLLEAVIGLCITVFFSFFLFYFCISLGQTFKRMRIFWAVAIYFALYTLYQLATTVAMIILTVVNLEWSTYLIEWGLDNPIAAGHIILLVPTVIMALLGWLYYGVSKHVLTKKLNLE